MTNKKDIHPHRGGEQMSSEMAQFLSDKQTAYDKTETQHFPIEDKRKVARAEHTNGSTSRKDS